MYLMCVLVCTVPQIYLTTVTGRRLPCAALLLLTPPPPHNRFLIVLTLLGCCFYIIYDIKQNDVSLLYVCLSIAALQIGLSVPLFWIPYK